MTILASPQTATVNITAPGAYITVSCAQGDVMQVDWVSPGNVAGTRIVRLPAIDVGPFVDDTVVTLRAITGAPDYVVVQGAGGGSGTVTSVNITQPAAGITVSGGPVTTSGAITLALADDLAAVEGLASTGIVRRTSASTWSAGTAVDLALEVAGMLPVANGGTGVATRTAYAPVFGGTTATGPTQSGTTGTTGQVLTSNGAAALPTFQAAASGGTPGGADTQPQFNNAGAFAGMAGITWVPGTSTYTFGGGVVATYAGSTSGAAQLKAPAVAGAAVITLPGVTSTLATLGANTFTDSQIINAGTKTTSAPIISGTQTWNAGGVTFDADLINVTDTASSAGSYLTRRQVGGSDMYTVTKAGNVKAFGTLGCGGSYFRDYGSGQLGLGTAADWYYFSSPGLQIAGTRSLLFGSSIGTYSTYINSPSAAVIQLGAVDAASPVAQTLRTQGSRVGIDNNVGAGKLTLGPGPGTGTGTLASLDLVSPVAVASGFGVQTQTRGLQIINGIAVRTIYAAAGLPTPSAAIEGGMAWCNDATMTYALGVGTIVAGGNSNKVPVSCDGTNWRIG